MSRYRKTIMALLGSLATWGITAAEDGSYSQVELWGALLALVTAAGVYAVPNRPGRGQRPRAYMSEQGAVDANLVASIVIGIVLAVGVLYVLRLAF